MIVVSRAPGPYELAAFNLAQSPKPSGVKLVIL